LVPRTKREPAGGTARRRIILATLALVLWGGGVATGQAPDLLRPEQHLAIEQPGKLNDAEAEELYLSIRQDLHRAYERAGYEPIARFGGWRRFNATPYVSATHGQRYVNNYANAMALAYGDFEEAADLPPGAVLAKDSFTVTRDGKVFGGALFVMEKMPPGFNPASHDWRYTMIMPDGSFFGTTLGEGNAGVAFCITCHESVPEQHQQLFFVPDRYRMEGAAGQ
jgi:hypothetical protein